MGSVYRPWVTVKGASKRQRSKSWFIQWRENGRRYKRRVGPIKKEAEMALLDTEERARLRRSGRAGEDIPIDKLIDDFLAYSETNHAPSTTVRYAHSLKRFKGFLRTQRGVRNISQVTPESGDMSVRQPLRGWKVSGVV